MRKILPAILIILISLNTFGFNFILGYLLYSCKKDFKEFNKGQLIKNPITCFRLSLLDKTKLKRYDDEINYDGKMYDIIKEEKKNNDDFIYCISDEKEDVLNQIINKRTDEQNNPSKINYLQKNLAKIYLSPNDDDSPFIFNSDCYIESGKRIYYSHFSDIISPPPNLI